MLVIMTAIGTFLTTDLVARSWTVAERTRSVGPLTGPLLWNRVIWVGVAAIVLIFTYFRFKLTTAESGKVRRRRLLESAAAEAPRAPAPAMKPVAQTFGRRTSFKQFTHQAGLEIFGALTGIPFLVMLFFGVLNVI